MLTALIARGPVPGAKVKTYNATATMAVPGVKQVVVIPSGVAVLADNFWAAKNGRAVLRHTLNGTTQEMKMEKAGV